MVPFFVQFKCKLGQSYAVANALAEAEIASEIYSTAGDYDCWSSSTSTTPPTSAISSTEGAGHSRHPGHPHHHHLQGVRRRLATAGPSVIAVDFARRAAMPAGLWENPSCLKHQSPCGRLKAFIQQALTTVGLPDADAATVAEPDGGGRPAGVRTGTA